MDKFIGILGGMGTDATNYFYQLLHSYSDASCDQEHLNVLLYNHAKIPDRTHYILHEENNPTQHLVESAQLLENAKVDFIVIPCNTAHYFYEAISSKVDIPVINLIDEVLIEANTNKVGILATKGTIQSNLYGRYASKYKMDVVYPDHTLQEDINKIIYQIKEGINVDVNVLNKQLQVFVEENNLNTIILACTELSLIVDQLKIDNTKIIDSNSLLAKLTYQYGKGIIPYKDYL